MQIRSFIALEVTDSLKAKISELQSVLNVEGVRIKWVEPNKLHLTLKFLGNIEESFLPSISSALQKAAQENGPLTLSFSGLGVFPNTRRPRVVWVGVKKGVEKLTSLYESVEEQLKQQGFEPEKRKFSPHLTIGRIKSSKRTGEFINQMKKTGLSSEEVKVEQIVLMKSELKPTGAVYTPLRNYRLQGE